MLNLDPISWTEDDAASADYEGWLIVVDDTVGATIQRRDYEPLFSSDAQALMFVEKKARAASVLHQKAIALISGMRLGPVASELFEQMKASQRYELFGDNNSCFVRLIASNIDYCLTPDGRVLLYARATDDPDMPCIRLGHQWRALTQAELQRIPL